MTQKTETELARDAHAHHWLIEEPTGPSVNGTCRICGESRMFQSSITDNMYLTNEERRAASV